MFHWRLHKEHKGHIPGDTFLGFVWAGVIAVNEEGREMNAPLYIISDHNPLSLSDTFYFLHIYNGGLNGSTRIGGSDTGRGRGR